MDSRGFKIDLQFHVFQGSNYNLLDILEAMEKRGLDGLGFLGYNWDRSPFSFAAEESKEVRQRYVIERDDNILFFDNRINGKTLCLVLGEEVAVLKNKWHIIAVGVTGIKSSIPYGAIEEILTRGGIAIIDHPFANPQKQFRDISKERERELFLMCSHYAGQIALEWNGYCLPLIRKVLPGRGDINKKVEQLANFLNLPLVPTTDLHARNKQLLSGMGTACIEIPAKDIRMGNLLSSLKENILGFNFTAHKRYVSLWHFARAWGVPVVLDHMSQKR